MKILYIYNRYQGQGGENLWVESEPDLFRAAGHQGIVYRRDNEEIQQFSFVKKASLLWKSAWSGETYQAVRTLIKTERPDIAHVYNTVPLITPSVYHACHDEEIPVVQSVYNYRLICPTGTLVRDGRVCEECLEHSVWRGVRYGCYRDSKIQTAAMAWTLWSNRQRGTWSDTIDCYLTPTEFVKSKLIQGGMPAHKIRIKPNWHEPDPGMRNQSDGSVLYIGRLVREKGIDTVLGAWEQMENPPLLRIIGDGPARDKVEHAVGQQKGKSIEYLGNLPHNEVIFHLKLASVFLLPCEWYEGFPHTILEAYACGVPILASRIGTLADVVLDGRTGELFEPGNTSDLAAKIEGMLRDPEKLRLMGTAGRSEYVNKYTGKQIYKELLGIYQEQIDIGRNRQGVRSGHF